MSKKKPFNRIKAVLAEHRKTNLWLADQLDVSKTTVSRWCSNTMQPTMEKLHEIASVLKIDVRELLVSSKQKKNS